MRNTAVESEIAAQHRAPARTRRRRLAFAQPPAITAPGEALLNTPATAHILGGAVIGASAQEGVVDSDQKAFGYERLLVCDGSVVPANPGVNPSLTITALAERAMAAVPDAEAG